MAAGLIGRVRRAILAGALATAAVRNQQVPPGGPAPVPASAPRIGSPRETTSSRTFAVAGTRSVNAPTASVVARVK